MLSVQYPEIKKYVQAFDEQNEDPQINFWYAPSGAGSETDGMHPQEAAWRQRGRTRRGWLGDRGDAPLGAGTVTEKTHPQEPARGQKGRNRRSRLGGKSLTH